jgi:hypothetical protein
MPRVIRCNIKLAILGVLLGIGLFLSGGKCLLVLNTMISGFYYGQPQCPHPAFIKKHWCQEDCTTKEDALVFSLARRLETGRNTVLAGYTTFDRDPEDSDMCKNVALTTVYQCNLAPGNCWLFGNNCTVNHHTYSGHMFYQKVDCSD